MLAIVLALASAISYGGSDFAAGLAARSAGVIQISLLASLASGVVVAAALPFKASPLPGAAALAWGAVAGLGGTLGALALYLGFRHAAGFSVLAGLLLGERPTALALAGIVLALPAIVGVSASAASAGGEEAEEADAVSVPSELERPLAEEALPGPSGAGRPLAGEADAASGPSGPSGVSASGRPLAGVAYGLVAGAFFALLFIGLDQAGSGSGLWPVAATAVGEMAVAFAVAAATRNVRLPAAGPRLLAVITGLAGAAGTILFFFASQEGFLAITSVLTSLYPAVTILLARTVLGERLTALRLAGLALAGACVALIAAGGAG